MVNYIELFIAILKFIAFCVLVFLFLLFIAQTHKSIKNSTDKPSYNYVSTICINNHVYINFLYEGSTRAIVSDLDDSGKPVKCSKSLFKTR